MLRFTSFQSAVLLEKTSLRYLAWLVLNMVGTKHEMSEDPDSKLEENDEEDLQKNLKKIM